MCCALSECVCLKIAWKCLRNGQIKLLKNYSSWNLKRLKLGHFLGLTLLPLVLSLYLSFSPRAITMKRSSSTPFLSTSLSVLLENLLILPLDAFNFYSLHTLCSLLVLWLSLSLYISSPNAIFVFQFWVEQQSIRLPDRRFFYTNKNSFRIYRKLYIHIFS